MKLARSKLLIYTLLLVYIIGGLIAVILSLVYHWNKECTGLAFSLGAILSLLISRRSDKIIITNGVKKEKKHISRFSEIVLIISLCLSVFSIVIFLNSKQNYYLPLQYFLIVSLIGLLISMQILFSKSLSKHETYLILLEIFILSGIVSVSFLFLFPGPYGNDAPYHVEFIKSIIASGNTQSYHGQYQNYPGYHLLFVFIDLITGLCNLKIAQSVIALVQVLFLTFVFILTKKLLNEKVALISTLLVSLSPHILQPRYVYFPCAFTAVFSILVIYLLLYPNYSNSKTTIFFLLLIVVFITTVFFHPLPPAILVIAFFVIFITRISLIRSKKLEISRTNILFISIFTLVTLFTLIWWMKPIGNQQSLFSTLVLLVKNALRKFDFTAVERATLAPLYSLIDITLIDLGFTILILFGIAGAFYTLRRICINNIEKSLQNKEKLLYLSTIALIFIPVPYLLTLIFPQSLPDRWFPFIEILASMFAGIGILVIFKRLKRYKLHYTLLFVLFITIFFMITTPTVNPNNQLYAKELSGRSALTQSEIGAAEFINWLNPQRIHANSKYVCFINRTLADPHDFININEPNTYRNGLVVIREYDLEKGFTIPLFGSKGKLLEIIYPNEQFYTFINKSNKLYENGEVMMYFNKE